MFCKMKKATCILNRTIQSYAVLLMEISKKFWDGYSKTTQKHVNDFSKANSFDTLGKKDWESLSVDTDPIPYNDHENANMGNQCYGISFACR